MAQCTKCGNKARWMSDLCDSCMDKTLADAAAAGATAQAEAQRRAAERITGIGRLHSNATTALELPGRRIQSSLGIVRGLSVRSPKIGQGILANLETIGGGENTPLAKMCDDARQAAFDRMLGHAFEVGANAVIGCRYDANDVAPGITEVLCYGTAVVVESEEARL